MERKKIKWKVKVLTGGFTVDEYVWAHAYMKGHEGSLIFINFNDDYIYNDDFYKQSDIKEEVKTYNGRFWISVVKAQSQD